MERVPTNSPKTIRFYNLFLCLLGIHTKLLDFHDSFSSKTNATVKPLKQSLLKLVSAIIFIAFVLHYPILVETIISNLPFEKNKKRVEFFVYYAHFYIKYLVIIVTFVFELLFEKSTIHYQHKIESNLLRLDKMFANWSAHSHKNQFKSTNLRETLTNLSILTKSRMFGTVVATGCSFGFNCLKYSYAFEGCEFDHFYDLFFGSLPNVFISLNVLHFSTIIVQYTKLVRLLNKIMDVIANDIANRVSIDTKEPYWVDKMANIRYNVTTDKRQLQSAINSLSTLIETHDELKANIGKLRKYHSVQLNAVILNAFFNIIFEVRPDYLR